MSTITIDDAVTHLTANGLDKAEVMAAIDSLIESGLALPQGDTCVLTEDEFNLLIGRLRPEPQPIALAADADPAAAIWGTLNPIDKRKLIEGAYDETETNRWLARIGMPAVPAGTWQSGDRNPPAVNAILEDLTSRALAEALARPTGQAADTSASGKFQRHRATDTARLNTICQMLEPITLAHVTVTVDGDAITITRDRDQDTLFLVDESVAHPTVGESTDYWVAGTTTRRLIEGPWKYVSSRIHEWATT